MKRMIPLLLALTLLLAGCGGAQAPAATTPATTPATQAPAATQETLPPETEAPTTVPTEPEIYRNPLNGEILDAPFTGRVFANTVSNLRENIPHVGVMKADILVETYGNMNNVVRCLALYTDPAKVDAIGCTRSTRPIFNQLAQHYSLILAHAGGSKQALKDAADRGIDNFNIDSWEVAKEGASYRDTEHKRSYENTLYGIGAGVQAYAQAQGIPMELERDYGFLFTESPDLSAGTDAQVVYINMIYGQAKKETRMVYSPEAGKYIYNQYGENMTDLLTGETEMFTNVLVMNADISNEGIYHVGNFAAGGTGYYATAGKWIPITWTCDGDTEPFRFFTEDGEPLQMAVGNTYLAIVPNGSVVEQQAYAAEDVTAPVAPAAETTPATEETAAANG